MQLIPSLIIAVLALAPIQANRVTLQITGYFYPMESEWMVFSQADGEPYDPYAEENLKCVSLINRTKKSRHEIEDSYYGLIVTMQGFAIEYSGLPIGDTGIDKTFERRYYEGEPVYNQCGREYVFVVTGVSRAK